MPIYGDILKASEESEVVDQSIGAGFFQNNMNLQQEELQPKEEEKTSSPLEDDWRTYIDRMFMKGMSADQIIDAIGEQINALQNAQEVLKYIKKYEGLIGTIFVDSKVLEQGFPMALMPKGWDQFHKFSINCEHPVVRAIQRAEGGLSGDIDSFLSSSDKNVKTEEEICSYCGLPVLRSGMFNKETISGIMQSLGREGDNLGQLQSAMKEIALKIDSTPKEVIEFEKPDTNFGLSEQKINVKVNEDQGQDDQLKYNLKQNSINAKIDHANEMRMSWFKASANADISIIDEQQKPIDDLQLEYKKSNKNDVKMQDLGNKVANIKMDEELRF